jgi:hypothetical protein
MDYLGINSPTSLPALKDIFNIDIVMPTDAAEAVPEDAARLLVNEQGDLTGTEA